MVPLREKAEKAEREEMNSLKGIRFRGEFRDYQRRVLEGAPRFLNDGKINIVAPPGSGKTVLGLELICRLGEPCLILSPTTTIRDQWGERFESGFLPEGSALSAWFSDDLTTPRPLTSVTYQALHAAMEEEAPRMDLPALMRERGVRTLCLDEAHHLQNEWQRALERFLTELPELTVISLTATPPYDADPPEWARYTAVCGEIDEEIFVPELVRAGDLCPHQDYLYFTYPAEEELQALAEHRRRAEAFVAGFFGTPLFSALPARLRDFSPAGLDRLYRDAGGAIALLCLLRAGKAEVPPRLIRAMTGRQGLPRLTAARAERAFDFLLSGELCAEEEKEALRSSLKEAGLWERGRAALDLNEGLRRKLISSAGKLSALPEILRCERAALGGELRMLVLTDYIRRESLSWVGTDRAFHEIGVVSLFETLRRAAPDLPMAALSGSLVILPLRCGALLPGEVSCTPLGDTGYASFSFGSNRDKVRAVGELFGRGEVRVLVGTKSLLGEGWDSPCVNALVLASFVGSFMLSNQMRGRAIRVDPSRPQKTANIWHLVTVEPARVVKKGTEKLSALLSGEDGSGDSADLQTAVRRFRCFIGPNYETSAIESGMERLTFVRPPFDRRGVAEIDRRMLAAAGDRAALREKWEKGLGGKGKTAVAGEAEISQKPTRFAMLNVLHLVLVSLIWSGLCAGLLRGLILSGSSARPFGILLACLLTAGFLWAGEKLCRRIVVHLSPMRSAKTLARCVLETFQEGGLIGPEAALAVECDEQGVAAEFSLKNASVHEQNLFAQAAAELFSPIRNPRFLLIGRGLPGFRYACSLACPSAIGEDKKLAGILAARLKKNMGRMEVVYTRTEKGRALILKCRNRSLVTLNRRFLDPRQKVSRWE